MITEPKLRKVDGYVVDCIESETRRGSTEVTKHPIESGAVISDHARNAPITIDLVVHVSDTPIGDVERARTAGAIHSAEASAFFWRLRDERRPFTFEGVTGTYADMLIEEISQPVTAETGGRATFEVTLTKVEILSVRRLSVQERRPRLGHRTARDVEGEILWYCPDLVVSNHFNNNVGKQCRRVVHKANGFVFADTGEPLSAYQQSELARQRQEVDRLEDGAAAGYVTRTEDGRYSKAFERLDTKTGKIRSVGMGIDPASPQARRLDEAIQGVGESQRTTDQALDNFRLKFRPPDDDIAGTTGKWY